MKFSFACKNLKQKVLFNRYKNRHEQGLRRNRVRDFSNVFCVDLASIIFGFNTVECVNYVYYSFLINGESMKSVNFRESFVKETFYSYIYLSYILKLYRICVSLSKIKKILSGFKVARCALFVDDTMFFYKSNPKNVRYRQGL